MNIVDVNLLYQERPEFVRVIKEYKPDKNMLNTILYETGEVLPGTELSTIKQYVKIS